MGNSQTNTKKQNKKAILIEHPEFKNAQIVKTTLGKQLIEIGISMKSEQDYLEWQKNYKRIPRVNSILYPQNSKFQNKGCCGSSGIAYIQYQRYPYILAQQINLRRTNNQGHFDENELWLLLYTLASSGQMFHIRKLKVGDIRPQNIFMNSQRQIKVASQYSYPYASPNYQKTLMNRQIITFLAPQEVKDIQFGKMKDTNDPSTVQSFSIGLTLLDAALLSSSDKLYKQNALFSFDKLNQSLRLLNHLNIYSPQLINIITKMCSPQPAKRLKDIEVLKLLKPYQNQILLRNKFPLNGLSTGGIQQNPENSIDISRISINKNQKAGDFKFVPGVVFQSKDDSLMMSSLKHSKEVVVRHSKIPNIYQIPQGSKIESLQTPIQTTIHYPPITISLPQPIQHIAPHHQNH